MFGESVPNFTSGAARIRTACRRFSSKDATWTDPETIKRLKALGYL